MTIDVPYDFNRAERRRQIHDPRIPLQSELLLEELHPSHEASLRQVLTEIVTDLQLLREVVLDIQARQNTHDLIPWPNDPHSEGHGV